MNVVNAVVLEIKALRQLENAVDSNAYIMLRSCDLYTALHVQESPETLPAGELDLSLQ